MLPENRIHSLLERFDEWGITPGDFVLLLLQNPTININATTTIYGHAQLILESLADSDATAEVTASWAILFASQACGREVAQLSKQESGFHFPASRVTERQLKGLDIKDMADRMQKLAPITWKLLDVLVAADSHVNYRRVWNRQNTHKIKKQQSRTMVMAGAGVMKNVDDSDNEDDDSIYWQSVDELPVFGTEEEDHCGRDKGLERFDDLLKIKKVTCLSVFMQSTNRRCNALQSLVGIFLHSCGAPETVRELFAHMGLSISTTTINKTIKTLSLEAENQIRTTGQGLLTLYGFDNLDINLKHSTPSLEKSQDTLTHLTTATMVPLQHGITRDDLNCAETVWKSSVNNPDTGQSRSSISLDQLLSIHREDDSTPHPSGLPARRQRFNAWKYLNDLINYGPEYFHRFRGKLNDAEVKPDVVDAIPVTKTAQVPMRAMDIKPSTPAEIGDALVGMTDQAGVGDRKENPRVVDVENLVLLKAGDLLTGQHLRSLMESRSEESTPWRRLQHVVFVMGLFHLKMACADALWRLFIHPKLAKEDPCSLIKLVSQIRPKETGKIESKPAYRQMHEVIQHIGIVLRLDAWRIVAAERFDQSIDSLETFAGMKPTWDILVNLSRHLCRDYVTTTHDLSDMRRKPTNIRDQQHENVLIQHQYFLLYEEISYAMNYGDIGRVETLFMPWIWIFRSCGKHKYATELRRYLENIHFIYPEGLRKAIRKNILCNPTGKEGAFRAIDWLVELNNLFTKVSHDFEYPVRIHLRDMHSIHMVDHIRTKKKSESSRSRF
ncbi:hypothetical protein JOM56_004349 [Amanita muscaria]